MLGRPSSSVIVPSPNAEGLLVLFEVTAPLSVKVSGTSFVVSSVVFTLNVTEVCPAGIVT